MPFGSLFGSAVEEGDKEHELRELKQRYASLERAYDSGKLEYDQVVASNANGMRQLSALREKNGALQERNAVLERELQAAKDDLFRLQPIDQVPDSDIAKQFEDLNDQICDRINVEISKFLDEWQVVNPDDQPRLFHHNGMPLMKGFLTQYPDTGGEYLIRYTFYFHFQRFLFDDKTVLFGLGSDDSKWLKEIEEGMSRLQPAREPATTQAWRSETLASLAGMPEFSIEKRRKGSRLAQGIYDDLCRIFPIIRDNRESFETLYTKIVKPAVQLAITTQISTVSYQLEPCMSMSDRFRRSTVSKTDLGHRRMIDAATGKSLKPDSPIITNRYGDIGEQILLLAPGLFRCDTDRQIPLTHAIILVELYHPLGRRRTTTVEHKD